jgi:PUA domain protein
VKPQELFYAKNYRIACGLTMAKNRRYTLKSKESKKLLQEVSSSLGADVEQMLGTKTRIEVNETESGELFVFNGRALLAKSEDVLFFTLAFEELFSFFPKVVVDMGAVPYVCKGADVMAPGIRSVNGEFETNGLLIVVDERHNKPLAVGMALVSSEEMKTAKKGKVIKTLHYVGDKLWNQSKSV